jgi:PAS domain S-box-containing protein
MTHSRSTASDVLHNSADLNLSLPQARLHPEDFKAERSSPRTLALKLFLILAGIIIALLPSIIATGVIPTDWLAINEPLHAVVETTGSVAAILMAVFLIAKSEDVYAGPSFLVAMGLLSMGILDLLHASTSAGHGFVLLRNLAGFIGALWFASTWLPGVYFDKARMWRRWLPWAVIVLSLGIGIWILWQRDRIPLMMEEETFTPAAVTLNLFSGGLFLAAALRLLIDFGRLQKPAIYLFAWIAMLFGVANLTFPASELWDAKWWFWHSLRLLSYLLALGFIIREHQRTISDLRIAVAKHQSAEDALTRYQDHLEELVEERTAELKETNDALELQSRERKFVEEALRKSEERLEAVVDTSHNVIWLKDTQGHYLLVNRQYEAIFHVSRDQIKDRTDYDIFPEEIADVLWSNDLRVLEANTSLEFEEVFAHNGRTHIYLSNKYPLLDVNGVPYAICSISTDITERKRAEEREISERKKAEGWLHSLIAATQDAMISIDRENRVVLFNPAAEKTFGYSEAEIRGRDIDHLISGALEPEASDDIGLEAEPRIPGGIRNVEARRKSGEVFPAEMSITRIVDDNEIAYAAFVRDISEKKHLQQRLVESERLAAVGATASKLGHEIANPLNSMSITVQLLERRLASERSIADESVRSTLDVIKIEIRRLTALLNDFRSFYRRDRYNFRATEIGTVIQDVLGLESANYLDHGIETEMIFPDDLPLIAADRDKIKQALINLCKNAAEAMPDGGKITVRAYGSGERIVIEIADTGPGIPDGIDILQPFTTTKPEGTGLGLMIVRQIISAHGGTLTFTSARGKGTTFSLTLPRLDSRQT